MSVLYANCAYLWRYNTARGVAANVHRRTHTLTMTLSWIKRSAALCSIVCIASCDRSKYNSYAPEIMISILVYTILCGHALGIYIYNNFYV